jgi:hypothetical protein
MTAGRNEKPAKKRGKIGRPIFGFIINPFSCFVKSG